MGKDELDREAMDYAWKWFALHAGQRMQMLNFWLISMAFLTTGFVAAFGKHDPAPARGIAAGAAVVTVAFVLLEWRTRSLMALGREALRQSEQRFTCSCGGDEGASHKNPLHLVADGGSGPNYTFIIPGTQLLVAAGFVAAAIAV